MCKGWEVSVDLHGNRAVLMDCDHDFVLLGPEGGALGRHGLIACRLVEGDVGGGDPATVFDEEVSPGKKDADGPDIHFVFHGFRGVDDRALGNECPMGPVVKDR